MDYQTNDPKGWCGDPSRGAALGRPTVINVEQDTAPKVRVSRVRLDAGGYDPNGTYFGAGQPLFWVRTDEGDVDFVVRAHDRDSAKTKARNRIPNVRFFR